MTSHNTLNKPNEQHGKLPNGAAQIVDQRHIDQWLGGRRAAAARRPWIYAWSLQGGGWARLPQDIRPRAGHDPEAIAGGVE